MKPLPLPLSGRGCLRKEGGKRVNEFCCCSAPAPAPGRTQQVLGDVEVQHRQAQVRTEPREKAGVISSPGETGPAPDTALDDNGAELPGASLPHSGVPH